MTYLDVSNDPFAQSLSGVSDRTTERLARRGIAHVGWLAFITPASFALVTWVGRTDDARAFVTVTLFEASEHVALRTLGHDGRMVETATNRCRPDDHARRRRADASSSSTLRGLVPTP